MVDGFLKVGDMPSSATVNGVRSVASISFKKQLIQIEENKEEISCQCRDIRCNFTMPHALFQQGKYGIKVNLCFI